MKYGLYHFGLTFEGEIVDNGGDYQCFYFPMMNILATFAGGEKELNIVGELLKKRTYKESIVIMGVEEYISKGFNLHSLSKVFGSFLPVVIDCDIKGYFDKFLLLEKLEVLTVEFHGSRSNGIYVYKEYEDYIFKQLAKYIFKHCLNISVINSVLKIDDDYDTVNITIEDENTMYDLIDKTLSPKVLFRTSSGIQEFEKGSEELKEVVNFKSFDQLGAKGLEGSTINEWSIKKIFASTYEMKADFTEKTFLSYIEKEGKKEWKEEQQRV